MLVKFDKVGCSKHNLPYLFICSNAGCKCDVRLCSKCTQEHPKRKDTDEELLKESVYSKKIQIETEIVLKQYKHYEQYKINDNETSLLNTKNQENIKNVEMILKLINDEKKAVFSVLDEFNFNHFEVKKKLSKIKSQSSGPYLASLHNSQLTPIAVRMLSEIGLERLRKKVIAAHGTNQKYQDFLNAVKKYGSTLAEFLEGLGWKQKQMVKYGLGCLLSQWRSNKKVEICLDPRINYNLTRPRKNTKSKEQIEQSPRRRINVFTGQAYKVNSGKEN